MSWFPYLQVAEEDSIYGTMYMDNKLVKMDADGKIVKSIGTEGNKAGQFDSPNGVCHICNKP